eukprot:TRINITY_DN4342_c0_g1_i1.p2 TRINITY_DN4342_c0_g1~~TRINITY_DN4342_c0_g1_i1.p2  ORF type:complete len:198 (-),score=53.29 TRINITY_DN4342_c0_g1_i1:72-665(-)
MLSVLLFDEAKLDALTDLVESVGGNKKAVERSSLKLRPLAEDDDQKGFLDILGQLTKVETKPHQEFVERFNHMKTFHDLPRSRGQPGGCSYVIVVEDTTTSRIVATGSILFEYKFLRGFGCVAHIEDIVVDAQLRGLYIGRVIIEQLVRIARKVEGCYKIILDCSEKNVPFYEACGFKKNELQMALYLPPPSPSARL